MADKKQKLDETPASDTLSTTPIVSKTDLINQMVNFAAGMPTAALGDWLNKAIETSKHASDPAPDAAAGNAASVNMKGDAKTAQIASMREDVKALFAGNKDLTEDFIEKTTTLFEAAVSARVATERVTLQEAFELDLASQVEALTERLDEYCNYAVSEWMGENEIAVDSSIKTDLAIDFMDAIQAVCREHNVDFGDEKVDVIDALADKVEALEAEANDNIANLLEAEKALAALRAEKVFETASEGLTDLDKTKFKQLTESLDAEDLEKLKEQLGVIREQNFGKGAKAATPAEKKQPIVEDTVTVEVPADKTKPEGPAPVSNPEMKNIVEAMTRYNKR